MAEPRKGTYAEVAAEYYDAKRHPTSANFRSASRAILRAWLPTSDRRSYCDVGAGDSLLAEVLTERKLGLEGVMLLDVSPEMMAHSERWAALGARTIIADAQKMPFGDEHFAVIVASLGDPYNSPTFWSEAARVVRRGGMVIFTTPSFEWAEVFRSRHEEPLDCAEFLLRDGSRVQVPSIVRPERQQVDLISESGLSVVGVYHVLLAALSHEPVSKKLEMSGDVPFVTGYLARRDGERHDARERSANGQRDQADRGESALAG